jgi:hypothetical protein
MVSTCATARTVSYLLISQRRDLLLLDFIICKRLLVLLPILPRGGRHIVDA